MENYLSFCKNFTMISFVAIGGLAFYKWWKQIKYVDMGNMDNQLPVDNLHASDEEVIGFIVGFFIFNIVIRVFLHKYPLRIYKNNSKSVLINNLLSLFLTGFNYSYTAVFQGQIPFTTKYTNFVSGEVVGLPPKGVLPWKESRYRMKSTDVIMLSEYFKTPAELNSMMKHCK